MIPFSERPCCTIAEACEAVGIGRTKLHHELAAGHIASVKLGKRRLISVPSLLKLVTPKAASEASEA